MRMILQCAAVALVGLAPMAARAADHADGTPAALNQPDASSDITDVFAWMGDATHVNLVMDVFPGAVAGSKFSNAVRYVFHTQSKASLLAPTATPATVICSFDTNQLISCWVVANNAVVDYVTGDPSSPTGLSSASGKVKVFAGLRDDPFFFNLPGFKNAAKIVAGAIKHGVDAANGPITAIDANGCPTLTSGGTTAVVTALQKNAAGSGPGVDFFAKGSSGSADQPLSGNVLSIVVSVDKALISSSGAPIVGVWGSTNKAQ